jgi:hypothetical protein
MSIFNHPYNAGGNVRPGPTAWERLLLSMGVAERGCASLVTGDTRKGKLIRSWIQDNYARRYVPEYILEALGLQRPLSLKWQGEERHGASYGTRGKTS